VLDCSLRPQRCSLGCRRLRRSGCRNGRALFRHGLLQIGGANITVVYDAFAMRRPCVKTCNLSHFHTDIHRLCTKAPTTGCAYHGCPGIEVNE